jgi:excisionase family DNA binding protein
MLRDDLIKGAKEASSYTGMKYQTIYRLCGKGEIPFTRIGRRLFFRKSELDCAFTAHIMGTGHL